MSNDPPKGDLSKRIEGSLSTASGPLVGSDPSSPYYLNASDNPGAVLVSSTLRGENYNTWRRAMQNALRAKNKLGFVDGTLPMPDENSDHFQVWNKCNSMVISWLFNGLAPELHDSVAYVDLARDLWVDLQERFSQGNAPRVHELRREIALMQQQDQSVAAYFTKLKGLWDELTAYSEIVVCTCGAAKSLMAAREEEKLHNFLMGLNDRFGSL